MQVVTNPQELPDDRLPLAEGQEATEYYAAERRPDGRWQVRLMRTVSRDRFGHNWPVIDPEIDEMIEELPPVRTMTPRYLKVVLGNIHGKRPARHLYNGAWLVL